jgi:hypothetical protein
MGYAKSGLGQKTQQGGGKTEKAVRSEMDE